MRVSLLGDVFTTPRGPPVDPMSRLTLVDYLRKKSGFMTPHDVVVRTRGIA